MSLSDVEVSIISLADSFGLQTVAEGVETEVAAAILIALGCAHAQGYLYAKPGPAQEIESILEMKRVVSPDDRMTRRRT